jgi:hypothetical protein
MSADAYFCATLTPLHVHLELDRPEIDLVSQFRSLIVLLRDEQNVGVMIEFKTFYMYRSRDEANFIDEDAPRGPRSNYHWMYETSDSQCLENFKRRNQHLGLGSEVRHFIIATPNDIIDVIAYHPPEVSKRKDSIRGWTLRPEESANLPHADIQRILLPASNGD